MNSNKYKNYTYLFFIGYLIAILLAVLSSCQTTYPRAKKKFDKLVKMYPELLTKDTIIIKDTIIYLKKVVVPEYRDSFIIKRDTVINTKKLFIEKKGDRFNVVVKPDTLELRDTVYLSIPVVGPVIKERNWNELIYSFLAGVILLLLLYFLKK